jgi:methionine-rich copper-binding protein CopC
VIRVAAAIAATLAFAALPVIVLGHAALVTSDPADGATIKTPYTLTATFDDTLTPNGSSILVQAANGNTLATGTVSATDAKVMSAQLSVLPEGPYTVLWTAVTADDSAITRGTYHFNVGAAGASVTPAPTPSPGGAAGSGSDVLIAMGLAAAIIVVVVVFVFVRGRR